MFGTTGGVLKSEYSDRNNLNELPHKQLGVISDDWLKPDACELCFGRFLGPEFGS